MQFNCRYVFWVLKRPDYILYTIFFLWVLTDTCVYMYIDGGRNGSSRLGQMHWWSLQVGRSCLDDGFPLMNTVSVPIPQEIKEFYIYIYIYLSISLLSQEISPFLKSLNTYIIEVELKGISRVCVLTGCWLVGWGSEFSCPERLHWVSTWSPGRVGLACRLPWSLDRHSGAIWFFLGCYQDIYIYI